MRKTKFCYHVIRGHSELVIINLKRDRSAYLCVGVFPYPIHHRYRQGVNWAWIWSVWKIVVVMLDHET